MKKILSESVHDFINEKKLFRGQVRTGLNVEDVEQKEFLLGLTIEKKHSSDLAVQKELTLQNLSSNPNFYSQAVKRGLFDDVEIINTYKKYFIDKRDDKEEK